MNMSQGKGPLFEKNSTRDELSVPKDMSGNSLEGVDTLADSREITRKSLSREKGENYITLVP